jgi:hypothetical protein
MISVHFAEVVAACGQPRALVGYLPLMRHDTKLHRTAPLILTNTV